MKTRKRCLLLLILALTVCLCACGSSDYVPDDSDTDNTIETPVVPEPEKSADDTAYTALAGTWFLNGERSARDWIEIKPNGAWEFFTMLDGDTTPTTVNEGMITGSPDGEDRYRAVSDWYADDAYDLRLVSSDTISWGEQNDIYGRLPMETDGGDQ